MDRTFQGMAGTQSTGPEAKPTALLGALYRACRGRAISGEAGMLASVCHDGLISKPPCPLAGPQGGLSDPWGSRCRVWQARSSQRCASSPSGSVLACLGSSGGGSRVGHGVLSPVGSDAEPGESAWEVIHCLGLKPRFSHLLNCVTMPETSLPCLVLICDMEIIIVHASQGCHQGLNETVWLEHGEACLANLSTSKWWPLFFWVEPRLFAPRRRFWCTQYGFWILSSLSEVPESAKPHVLHHPW